MGGRRRSREFQAKEETILARMDPLGLHEVDDEIRHLCEEAERQSGTSASRRTYARNPRVLKALTAFRTALAREGTIDPVIRELVRIKIAKSQRGHWLPVDAEPNSSANWISNIAITDILNAMNVQQLLVVADSCYAGTLTRSSVGRLDAALSETERLKVIQLMARKRSRMVMTSGGLEPVLDSVGGSHSVFAQPFIELLQTNVGVLSGQEMFRLLQLRVAGIAQRVDAQQIPEYAPIKFAGHEAGDFFFVRASN